MDPDAPQFVAGSVLAEVLRGLLDPNDPLAAELEAIDEPAADPFE